MKNLLSPSFWFNIRAGELASWPQKSLIIFCLILAIIYIISIILQKKNSSIYFKVLEKIKSLVFTNFFIGLLLLFFTYEAIPLLSARFWFLIWFGSMFFWTYRIVIYSQEIPKRKEAFLKEKEFKKYIP